MPKIPSLPLATNILILYSCLLPSGTLEIICIKSYPKSPPTGFSVDMGLWRYAYSVKQLCEKESSLPPKCVL